MEALLSSSGGGQVAKDESLVIRIEGEVKRQLEAAASREGLSLSTFVIRAAMAKAQNVLKKPEPAKGAFRGVPTFFRALCDEATRGGSLGYEGVGFSLARTIPSMCPDDLTMEEWESEVETLVELVKDETHDLVWSWLVGHFPKCMELVPSRRKDQFLAGFYRHIEENGIEF
jgi:hypothetical protein